MLGILILTIGSLWYSWHHQKYQLSIAAGAQTGQAYQLMKALQTVTHRHHPELRIEVFESRGSLQNARLLERGAVDLATTQADLVSALNAHLVAELYSDAFQLIVRRGSGIEKIGDLVGKRIALPPERSGAYRAFWFLAGHYGLGEGDIQVFPGTQATTDWLLINGDVDAMFRVRAPGDETLRHVIDKINARVIEIPQAAALKLKQPAYEVGTIPQGSYKGRPSVPESDLTTVSVKRLLLARDNVSADAISRLTSILFERRRELIDLVPLAGSISVPDRSSGTFLPVHEGAQSFYDRDQPSFLQENAEPIALIVSILVVLASAYLQISALRRKRFLDRFNRELLALARAARRARSFRRLDEYDTQLGGFVERIVEATEEGRINAHDFQLFHFTYEAAEDAIRDREQQLERARRRDKKQSTTRRRRPSRKPRLATEG
jgi:TRAP transporter TAXI family solute receptor